MKEPWSNAFMWFCIAESQPCLITSGHMMRWWIQIREPFHLPLGEEILCSGWLLSAWLCCSVVLSGRAPLGIRLQQSSLCGALWSRLFLWGWACCYRPGCRRKQKVEPLSSAVQYLLLPQFSLKLLPSVRGARRTSHTEFSNKLFSFIFILFINVVSFILDPDWKMWTEVPRNSWQSQWEMSQ